MIENKNKLLKLFGVGFGIAVTVGGTIGTGILRKPGIIAAQLGDVNLIFLAWLAVGIYAFFGVLCAIELGVSLPQAGSWYVYARKAFGDYFGFLTGIISWIGTIASLAFGAYTMAEYIALLFPTVSAYLQITAILVLVILTVFHTLGTKSGGFSQEILAAIKFVGLVLFILVCFIYGQEFSGGSFGPTSEKIQTPTLLFGLIASLQAIFYTFDGWHTAAYFSEENTDIERNLPRAMISGVLLIIVIYLLINAAIMYVLPMQDLANSELAAAKAIDFIFGPKTAKIVTLFLMISILGIVNAQIMFAPRIIFSMARDGLFFKSAEEVSANGNLKVGLPLTTFLSILFILPGKDTCSILSDIATFFFVLAYISGFASLIELRKKFPDLPRPFKVIAYPYVPIILLLISVAFLIGAVYQDINSSKYALVFLVLSYPIYLGIKKYNSQNVN